MLLFKRLRRMERGWGMKISTQKEGKPVEVGKSKFRAKTRFMYPRRMTNAHVEMVPRMAR